jgi:hypothetical protein
MGEGEKRTAKHMNLASDVCIHIYAYIEGDAYGCAGDVAIDPVEVSLADSVLGPNGEQHARARVVQHQLVPVAAYTHTHMHTQTKTHTHTHNDTRNDETRELDSNEWLKKERRGA